MLDTSAAKAHDVCVAKHTYQEFDEDIMELAYHLVYDHGMTTHDAFVALTDTELVAAHRLAHS